MRALYRVNSQENKHIGFIVEPYVFITNKRAKSIAENIDRIADETLPVISYKEFMRYNYEKICKSNPFIRDIQDELREWKAKSNDTVLQLDGSRQVGKTTELKKFAYKNYEYVIYVNLADDNDRFKRIMYDDNCVDAVSMSIYCNSANLPEYVDNDNTVLIIDEIQSDIMVYNSIRKLRDNLNCDIIVTGSYLGKTIMDKEYFKPAGTIYYLTLLPMSFREFARVFGIENNLMNMSIFGDTDKSLYDEIYKYYEAYRLIGGYPNVVKKYKEEKDVKQCWSLIEDLIKTFQNEAKNYFTDDREPLIFEYVYREAVKEMCNEKRGAGSKVIENVTKITKNSLKTTMSRDEVSRAVHWLIYCGLIGVCDFIKSKESLPVRRMYYKDCGVASYIASTMNLDESSIKGMITETFAFNELSNLYSKRLSNRVVNGSKVGFSLYNEYELDFVVTDKDNKVYGIEVKTDDGEPKSLRVYLEKGLIDEGIVAKNSMGGRGKKYKTIPIFVVGARFPYE